MTEAVDDTITPEVTESPVDTREPGSSTPEVTEAPLDTTTPEATEALLDTETPTDTPTETLTPSETPTPSSTPSETPTPSPSPSVTPTPSETPTLTPTSGGPAGSETATPSLTPTLTPTPQPGVPNVGGAHRWHYGYDKLQRVTYACSDWENDACTSSGHEFNYAYDGAGNLTNFDKWNPATNHVETVHYVYNGANQIDCIDTDANGQCGDLGDISYTYDFSGNLTDDVTTQYTYDAANRLASVTTVSVETTTETDYAYNGDGDRIGQVVKVNEITTSDTTYLLDTATSLTMVLAETSNGQTIYYWHGLDLLGQSDGTTAQYFQYDGLGSVRQRADDAGTLLYTDTFDPYGNLYASAGAEGQTRYAFTGEQQDANRLLFLRARYYSARDYSVGRVVTTA